MQMLTRPEAGAATTAHRAELKAMIYPLRMVQEVTESLTAQWCCAIHAHQPSSEGVMRHFTSPTCSSWL
jgi:hypothetical protein